VGEYVTRPPASARLDRQVAEAWVNAALAKKADGTTINHYGVKTSSWA